MSENNENEQGFNLSVEVRQEDGGQYFVWLPAFPGVEATGATPKEALVRLRPLADEALKKIEIFTYEAASGKRYRWNITAITTLCNDREVDNFPLSSVPLAEKYFVKTYPELNRNYALSGQADTSRPLIIIIDDGWPILIDGVHRLYKAWKNGLSSVPAYLFSTQEVSGFQIDASAPLSKSGL